MKKVLAVVISIFVMSCLTPSYAVEASNGIRLDDSLRLEHMVITLVMPEVERAVKAFYAPYLTITPNVVSYLETSILNIKGGEDIHTGGPNATTYTVMVEVFPYVGPHDAVGKDHITLEIDPVGTVTLKGFKHIESYELPWNLKSLVKKPLP